MLSTTHLDYRDEVSKVYKVNTNSLVYDSRAHRA